MPADPRRAAASVATAVLALLLVTTSSVTAVAPDLSEESTATFTLLPDEGRVAVENRITIRHRKQPTTRMDPCEDDPEKFCEVDVNYFWSAWGPIQVPATASNVEISVADGGAQMIEQDEDWVSYVVTFPELHYRQNRKVKISYDLPGAGPRSGLGTRVTDAYARFCWHGEPADGGSVTAILPAGYQDRTFGGRVKAKRSARKSTLKGTVKGDPAAFYACTDAFQPDQLARVYVLGPSEQVITVDNWPEDPEWRDSLLDVVGVDLAELERLIGSPMRFDELTVLEVARTSPFGSSDDFDPARAQLRIGDDLDTPGVATTALARTWFNEDTIADPWLREGLALWSGLTAAGAACPVLDTLPDQGVPDLTDWPRGLERPGSDAARMLEHQRAVACSIVADTAGIIGPEAMASVVASLVADTSAYGSQPAVPASDPAPADWHDWLDAVDELGLMPAGGTDLEVAERTLLEHGIASAGDLATRASARAIYHEALDTMNGTAMPAYVNDLMADWSFSDALPAVVEAGRAYRTITEATALTEVQRTEFLDAFESVASSDGLARLEQAVSDAS